MFSETRDPSPYNTLTPAATTSPLVELAQKYVGACDHFERLRSEMGKLNEELKHVDNARREFREQLLQLINQAVEDVAVKRAY